MNAQEFRAKLEKLENGKELLKFHIGVIGNERQVHISETQKKNSEAHELRKFKNAFVDLGYNDKTELKEFISTIKTVKADGAKKDLTLTDLSDRYTKLQGDFENLNSDLSKEREIATGLRTRAKQERIKVALFRALKDKVYGPDVSADNLVHSKKVDIGDDNKIVFLNDDNTTLHFDEGIKNYIESHPDIVKNSQNPGGGSKPVDRSPGGTNDTERLKALRLMASGGHV